MCRELREVFSRYMNQEINMHAHFLGPGAVFFPDIPAFPAHSQLGQAEVRAVRTESARQNDGARYDGNR